MNRPVVVLLIAALTGAPAPLTAQQQARGPCELLSATEIAKFLAVPAVRLDSVNTGTNEFTKVELCSWFVALRDRTVPKAAVARL